MTNKEQLLQEARIEAEKVYPVRKMHDENMYEREAFVDRDRLQPRYLASKKPLIIKKIYKQELHS
jgi:hypothetical protein